MTPCLAALLLATLLAADPAGDDESRLAMLCLERGNDAAGIAHLEHHLNRHPDQQSVRLTLAELLWQRDRLTEARDRFDEWLCREPVGHPDRARQLHCHARLADIASRTADAYGSHLHRGVALWLATPQSGEVDDDAEARLCRAADELRTAARLRPHAARPWWYLWRVWSRLGQLRPAAEALRRAKSEAALADDLVPVERVELAAAPR